MRYIKSILLATFLLPTVTIFAQAGKAEASAAHPAAIVFLTVIGLLAFVILLLGKVALAAYTTERKKKNNSSASAAAPIIVMILSLTGLQAFAQETAAGGVTEWIGGLSNTATSFLVAILVLELIIIFYLLSIFRSFTRLKRASSDAVAKKKFNWGLWLEKLNRTRTVDSKSEAEHNLGHDYDGIEELDNPTPPWWNWGFIISFVFAVVYLWVYFVSYSAPNQYQELEIANKKAEKQIQAFMASSANQIDENNVTYLDGAQDLSEGNKMYVANCAACHLVDGGGLVGPNLTDKYWMHGGSINDIFKTIKYGVPEKGMKSWKEDFTPKQIAQLASYVKSMVGTTPANPKEPQGDLYEEGAAEADE